MAELQAYGASLEGADAGKVLEDLEKELLEIADSTKDKECIDVEGIILDVNKEIQKAKDRGWLGFKTGFSKLDERTGGFIPTQSWIIGAYTGIGKTFFILQLLLNALKEGAKVVLFSTEMDRKMNMIRLIGNIAGLGTINMMRGNLLPNEEEEMRKAQKELLVFKDKLTIYDNVYTLPEIRLKAKKLKLTKGLDIVAVDFIQNLRGHESIYERMSEAAIGLQQIAQELDVTLLIGSQVSQAAAGWQSKEAIEFKGAGEIAAIADVAIWMTKVEGDEELRKVIIRKIRHGARKKFDVRLEFPSGRITDVEVAKEENVTKQL
jgi:replicative DNA helicase